MEITEVDCKIGARLGNARSVLDVGCGEGRLTWYLAQETGREIIGIDLSRSGFRKARRVARQAGVGNLVRCIKGDARHLNFPDGQFDVVILSYSLHHVEDSPAALQEIHRVLKPGGTIIISEHEVKGGGTLGDCYQFTLAELMKSLVEAGFADAHWERTDGDILLSAINKIREEAWTSNKS